MTNKNQIGVAIAGIGFGESVHLPALEYNKNSIPIAFWHPDSKKLNDSCNKYGLTTYSDWQSVLEDKTINAIIIATPPAPRFDLAKQALQAGKHLLLEKPISLNAFQGEELHRIAINNQLSVAVDFEYRAVPYFMQLKKILEERRIGDIWLVKFDWLMSSRADPSRAWNWYSNKEEGGGILGALGTHAFDILHWLFGPSCNVKATLSTSINSRLCNKTDQRKPVTSDDICMAQLELLDIKNNQKIPVQATLSGVTRQGRGCWIEIYGSEGTLILGSENQKDYVHGFGLWFAEKGCTLAAVPVDKALSFEKTWKDGRIAPVARIQNWWLKSIYEGTPIIPGLSEGISSQKVCDAINESNSSGLQINIS
tara:strand:- start:161 stop:1261 length:1101 start_codon:yes stop_codon:yes gene_type:complete